MRPQFKAGPVHAAVPSDKPPKNPTGRAKTSGRLKYPMMKVGDTAVLDLAKSSKPDEPRGKILRFVFTCQAARTQTFGTGKKAKSVTAPCNKRMAVYVEHGRTPRTVRCCFCYFVHKTSEVKASGHFVQEDL